MAQGGVVAKRGSPSLRSSRHKAGREGLVSVGLEGAERGERDQDSAFTVFLGCVAVEEGHAALVQWAGRAHEWEPQHCRLSYKYWVRADTQAHATLAPGSKAAKLLAAYLVAM